MYCIAGPTFGLDGHVLLICSVLRYLCFDGHTLIVNLIDLPIFILEVWGNDYGSVLELFGVIVIYYVGASDLFCILKKTY